jgi:hypothetical protein
MTTSFFAEPQARDFEQELDRLVEIQLENGDAENLRKRLIAHRNENFTFLRYKNVDPDNNRAERALRPSVVMRKITYGNTSQTGARNHETLMSLLETARLHNTDLLQLMMKLAANADPAKTEAAVFGRTSQENLAQPQPAPS